MQLLLDTGGIFVEIIVMTETWSFYSRHSHKIIIKTTTTSTERILIFQDIKNLSGD